MIYIIKIEKNVLKMFPLPSLKPVSSPAYFLPRATQSKVKVLFIRGPEAIMLELVQELE